MQEPRVLTSCQINRLLSSVLRHGRAGSRESGQRDIAKRPNVDSSYIAPFSTFFVVVSYIQGKAVPYLFSRDRISYQHQLYELGEVC